MGAVKWGRLKMQEKPMTKKIAGGGGGENARKDNDGQECRARQCTT